MAASVARLSLYALISAIEEDLRASLSMYLSPDDKPIALLGETLFKKAADRSEAATSIPATTSSLEELLLFCDYGDAIQLCNTHKSRLPESLNIQLKNLNSAITDLVATRNRVMHSRPLEFDDLAKTADLCDQLLKNTAFWPHLAEVKKQLSDEPDFVLKLSIPFEPDASNVSHNLPLPDFDETGFIGRRTTASNLKKAILGIYPVITIVGEGGLGKTSLALKVAYELLDQKASPFDTIIFVSAKTQKLTDSEIVRIKGAINTSVGVIESATKDLSGETSDSVDDLLEALAQFKVLLIIDNLETVLDDNIRDLLERLPSGNKILITTRIRIGAFEYPIQLEPLSPSEATQLLRATAMVRECKKLVSMSDARLMEYCRRMRNSPLHIKWFVSAVQAGQRPEAVLSDEKLFLQFCLSNVFNVISEDGRKLVRTLLSVGGSYTVAEMSFLTSMDQTTLLRAIGELLRTNMFFAVSMPTEASFETKYELSQLARAYLSRFYPVNKEEQKRLLLHKQKLVSAGEQVRSEAERNPLSASSIHCRTRSDWVIARYLRDAIKEIKAEKIDVALNLVEEAKSLAPDFSEVHRVEAFAHARAGNITSAYDSYERAIEFSPTSAVARMLFGYFLLRDVHDTERAAEQFKIASTLCPNLAVPKIEYARACLYLRDFPEAKKAIEQLESSLPQEEFLVMRITDLHLQLLTRRADDLLATHEPSKALDELAQVKMYFSEIETPDVKMLERIAKIRVTALGVLSHFHSQPDKAAQARNILEWIDSVLNDKPRPTRQQDSELSLTFDGKIKFIHRNGRFGFISQNSGEDVFFHTSRVARGTHPVVLVGHQVRFGITVDLRGRLLAINVVVIDDVSNSMPL